MYFPNGRTIHTRRCVSAGDSLRTFSKAQITYRLTGHHERVCGSQLIAGRRRTMREEFYRIATIRTKQLIAFAQIPSSYHTTRELPTRMANVFSSTGKSNRTEVVQNWKSSTSRHREENPAFSFPQTVTNTPLLHENLCARLWQNANAQL